MEIRAEEANTTQMLYEASMRGCVATFNTLIQNDPFILHKISLTAFTETPLHISALLGHVEFTKALVSQKPQLVTELDSFRRSPLHLASAEGHTEIVKVLLQTNKIVSLVADQDGRIPLHLAAIRGRVEVIQELISAKPTSVFERLHGETVLHLCVRYNHLDALKLLIASVDDEEFLNFKNLEGNTILQVSATLQQFGTTNFLLSVPQIRVDVNSLIENGFGGNDTNTNGTIQNNLQKAAVEKASTSFQSIQSASTKSRRRRRKEAKLVAESPFTNWRKLLKYKNDYYETTRGNLMVVAALIATMSFQVATNPPGGYWQNDITNQTNDQSCPRGKICKAGTAIHAYTNEMDYHILMIFSTLSFSASVSIILLLISGVPLRNRLSVGILVIGTWAAVLFVAIEYYFSVRLVVPHDHIFDLITHWYPRVWVTMFAAIILIHILRFCWWVVKKLFMGVIYVLRCCCCFCKNKQHDDQHYLVNV